MCDNKHHMVKFHEERYWQKVMSLFRVHSTHSCEANKSRNSKPFFAYGRSRTFSRSHQKKLKKINLRVRFLLLKIAFFLGFENDNILSSKSYRVTKSGISPQRKLGSL